MLKASAREKERKAKYHNTKKKTIGDKMSIYPSSPPCSGQN